MGYDDLTFDLHDVEEECNAKLVLSWEINETTNELSRTNLTWQCIFNPFKRSIWQFLINLMVFINFHNCTIPLQWLKNFITVKPQQNEKLEKKKFCLVDYKGKAKIPVHVHRSILENNILKFLLILRAVRNELATKI